MQLRIHGVGGADPRSSMAQPDPARSPGPGRFAFRIWSSEPSARSSVRATSLDPDLALYHWAPLTSGSPWFALWPVLLPFTLLSAAGWMAPPVKGLATLHRAAVWLLGLATTVAGVLWLGRFAEVVAASRLAGSSDVVQHRVASAGTIALMALVVMIAVRTSRGFDRWSPANGPGATPATHVSAEPEPEAPLDRWSLGADRRYAPRWTGTLATVVHITAVVSALLLVPRGDLDLWRFLEPSPPAWLAPARLTVIVLLVQTVLIAILVALAVLGWAWRAVAELHDDAPPHAAGVGAGAASLGALLVPGLAAAGCRALQPEDARVLPDVALVVIPALGAAAIAGGLAVAAVALWRLLTPHPEDPQEQSYVSGGMARALARASTIPRHLGPAVLALPLAILGTVVPTAWSALVSEARGEAPTWRLTASMATDAGRWLLVSFAVKIGLDLWRQVRKVEARNQVGVVWDVLTVWPRSFHPFAVRPYAERAVPELRAYLAERRAAGQPTTIVAHSQGSVLAAAAIASADPDALVGVRLVTMGSPLSDLHQRVFPCHVDRALLDRVAARTAEGGWCHAYRATDPVGQRIARPTDERFRQVLLPDPPTPGTPIASHSGYWRDPVFAALVADPLGAPAPPPPPSATPSEEQQP